MMFSSGLGILLSLIFGCLLLGLIVELYYLIWWRKQSQSLNTSSRRSEVDCITHAKQHLHLFCWNKPNTDQTHHDHQMTTIRRNPEANLQDPDLELGSGKDFLLKSFGEDEEEEDEGVESQFRRLHNLRVMFTIKEETKEDLESEDGKSRGGGRSRKGSRSFSDLILSVESPFLCPLASPPLKADLKFYSNHGFNPLFESSTVLEAELNNLRSSPPPKFKFLRDAEEKLYRRLLEVAEKKNAVKNGGKNGEGKGCHG